MAAAEAMRRILIESARAKQRAKRGGNRKKVQGVDLTNVADATMLGSPDLLLDVDAALNRLREEDPDVAELVQLRLYAGLTIRKTAEALGIPRSTAQDYWRFALSWFTVEMGG